jgi:hypothetical protein
MPVIGCEALRVEPQGADDAPVELARDSHSLVLLEILQCPPRVRTPLAIYIADVVSGVLKRALNLMNLIRAEVLRLDALPHLTGLFSSPAQVLTRPILLLVLISIHLPFIPLLGEGGKGERGGSQHDYSKAFHTLSPSVSSPILATTAQRRNCFTLLVGLRCEESTPSFVGKGYRHVDGLRVGQVRTCIAAGLTAPSYKTRPPRKSGIKTFEPIYGSASAYPA